MIVRIRIDKINQILQIFELTKCTLSKKQFLRDDFPRKLQYKPARNNIKIFHSFSVTFVLVFIGIVQDNQSTLHGILPFCTFVFSLDP